MDFSAMFKDFSDSVRNGPFHELFRNPIYMAWLITAVMLLMVIVMADMPLVKMGIYMLMFNLFAIFMHNSLMLIERKEKLKSHDEELICNAIGQGPTVLNTTTGGSDNAVDASDLGYLNNM
jgi:hypothetical protein